ncbi:hypothetical protein L5F43_12535 [Aliarcobacter butzleri]|uniref:Lipoprotein n=1 Tax=Aliarcobacter butzleri TaxID=28197 RepID=A0AAW6VJ11_9BACT|nr:hypothetical protein [Aliarcobacter butzleri]MCG3707300.1 hypothetical protein [Aliarcobacter butzleri]MCT7549909.1 hypothetical protein [Aliarcobacter butzleri]MCT7559543.1 hypothetical protein [Aliarcobacter butzleri]MDK2042172.1 hypothetical protein [Aliarcobacter butzleri]MDK2097039.1 hypothetical protein [Aliarcobacter butzleri]
MKKGLLVFTIVLVSSFLFVGCTAKTVWDKEDVAKLSDVEKDKHFKKEYEFLVQKLKKNSKDEIIGQKYKLDGYADVDYKNGRLEKDLYSYIGKKASDGNYYLSNFLGKTYYNGVFKDRWIKMFEHTPEFLDSKKDVIVPKSLVRSEEWFGLACKQKAEKEFCDNQKVVSKMLEKGLK